MFRKLIGLFVLILVLNSNTLAADGFKIGIVDFKQFMETSIVGKSIQKEIKDKGEQLNSELEKIQIELKELQGKYKREAPLWTQEQKQEKERSFRIRINDFNKLKRNNEKEFNEFRVKRINEAKGNILEYAKEKAQKEGYDLIFEKQTGSILYARGSLNITDELIREIDKSADEK
jgi:outer membrane protein